MRTIAILYKMRQNVSLKQTIQLCNNFDLYAFHVICDRYIPVLQPTNHSFPALKKPCMRLWRQSQSCPAELNTPNLSDITEMKNRTVCVLNSQIWTSWTSWGSLHSQFLIAHAVPTRQQMDGCYVITPRLDITKLSFPFTVLMSWNVLHSCRKLRSIEDFLIFNETIDICKVKYISRQVANLWSTIAVTLMIQRTRLNLWSFLASAYLQWCFHNFIIYMHT